MMIKYYCKSWENIKGVCLLNVIDFFVVKFVLFEVDGDFNIVIKDIMY